MHYLAAVADGAQAQEEEDVGSRGGRGGRGAADGARGGRRGDISRGGGDLVDISPAGVPLYLLTLPPHPVL